MRACRHETYKHIEEKCIRGTPPHTPPPLVPKRRRGLHRPPTVFSAMLTLPVPVDNPPSLFNVVLGADFGSFGNDFAAEFNFGADFGAAFVGNFGADFDNFGDFFGSSVSVELDDVSWSSSDSDSGSRSPRRRRRRRRKRRPNRLFTVESVLTSCWYTRFTRPGRTRQLTHKLSSSD